MEFVSNCYLTQNYWQRQNIVYRIGWINWEVCPPPRTFQPHIGRNRWSFSWLIRPCLPEKIKYLWSLQMYILQSYLGAKRINVKNHFFLHETHFCAKIPINFTPHSVPIRIEFGSFEGLLSRLLYRGFIGIGKHVNVKTLVETSMVGGLRIWSILMLRIFVTTQRAVLFWIEEWFCGTN